METIVQSIPEKKKKVLALSLLVVTKLIYAVFTLEDLKPLNRSTRIVHTDLFSSWKPLIFSVGPCFHLRSESTVLGCKLNTKCRTFNPLNFLPLRIESFSGFFLQKHPNSRKINQPWLNTFQRRSSKTLAKREPFFLTTSFSVFIELIAILVFLTLFSAFFWKLSLGITLLIFLWLCSMRADP